jgi:uncharacterized ion transporter superfamily protein YfcC
MTQERTKETRKASFKMPSTAALLMMMILAAGILTYIVPAGKYERAVDENTKRTIVVPGSYQSTEQSPIGVGDLFASVFNGLVKASEIIAFVFVVGGVFGLITRSGAINAGLGRLIKKFAGKEGLLIAIVMTAFAVGGATFGMAEETLPFIVILTAMAYAMGFDPIVGVSMVVVGVYCGYSAGVLNPFNTGIAQGIAQLPLFSGLGLRVVLMIGGLLIAIHHTIRYGKKHRLDKNGLIPESMQGVDIKKQFDIEMTGKHKLVLVVLLVTIAGMIFGVLKYGWYFAEISALFLAMGLLVGFITHGRDFDKIMDEFLKGAGEMTSAAIIVGLSRALLVIMDSGSIIDTVVYGLSIPLSHLNRTFTAWGMYIAQGLINFAIPSSSGQAVVVMPIMSALSDLSNVTRQTAVLAFTCGDGYWNMITPTHPVVMAAIGLAGIPFSKWFRFALPLVLKWSVWIMLILAIAVQINWGPF